MGCVVERAYVCMNRRQLCIYVPMYVCMRKFAFDMRIQIYIYMYIYIYVYIYIYMYVCVCVCVCV